MGGVVAGDVTKIAADAAGEIDAGDSAEGEIEVLEGRDAVEALGAEVGDSREPFESIQFERPSQRSSMMRNP